ncbi:MAG: tRNA (guanosine(37)-N1)-methyltransferase TrmD [Bacteroidetes bacterium]|nr:tRNA (guanosine(37)-N1)-methyltransferase TrmD [Bacteroidota bacterium]
MRIDIISIVPKLLESPFDHSIMKRAREKGLCGGAGMVMMCEPLANCIDDLKSKTDYDEIIYLSPDGDLLNQSICNQLSLKGNLLLICGHYKGIDQRIRDIYVTREISIGQYVISGGELAAAILVDAIGRIIPGVLNNETSALTDSFQDNMLAPPVYTRPADFRGHKVPEVLLNGNEAAINQWREANSREVE